MLQPMIEAAGSARQRALVIGASMAGLLAASALAEHFEQVMLLERDTLPPPGQNRKGVPQGKHTHVLLERGRRTLEARFTGLTEELLALGAVLIEDVSANVRWFHDGAYHQPGQAGFSSVAISRPLLEGTVRKRVLAHPNVQLVEGCNVRGLIASYADGQGGEQRVEGVRVVQRAAGDKEEIMRADLIVDASGRGSRSPVWLEELGYEQPAVDEVSVGVGYVTCFYRRQAHSMPQVQGILTMATPPGKRLAVFLPQDGDRWVLTIGGYLGDHAPTDPQGFLEAAQALGSSEIYDRLKDAEAMGQPLAYKFPANRRRRYDKLPSFPRGYLVLGDALCSFNPIYGQGMTVAALEAEALDSCLAQARAEGSLAQRFFSRANEIIDVAWQMAVVNDLSFAGVAGPRTPATRFFNWYLERLHTAAHNDAQVSIAFLKVLHMLEAPRSLLRPGVLWRALKGNL